MVSNNAAVPENYDEKSVNSAITSPYYTVVAGEPVALSVEELIESAGLVEKEIQLDDETIRTSAECFGPKEAAERIEEAGKSYFGSHIKLKSLRALAINGKKIAQEKIDDLKPSIEGLIRQRNLYQKMVKRTITPPEGKRVTWSLLAVAACAVLIMAIGGGLWIEWTNATAFAMSVTLIDLGPSIDEQARKAAALVFVLVFFNPVLPKLYEEFLSEIERFAFRRRMLRLGMWGAGLLLLTWGLIAGSTPPDVLGDVLDGSNTDGGMNWLMITFYILQLEVCALANYGLCVLLKKAWEATRPWEIREHEIYEAYERIAAPKLEKNDFWTTVFGNCDQILQFIDALESKVIEDGISRVAQAKRNKDRSREHWDYLEQSNSRKDQSKETANLVNSSNNGERHVR